VEAVGRATWISLQPCMALGKKLNESVGRRVDLYKHYLDSAQGVGETDNERARTGEAYAKGANSNDTAGRKHYKSDLYTYLYR